jgi:hypothetical protein
MAWMEEERGRIVENRTGRQNVAEFGQSWGFTLSMVKQLGSTWNPVKTCLKWAWYHYVWAELHIWKDFNEICDKHRSKVENFAKYVLLQEVGTFQIIISVTKY